MYQLTRESLEQARRTGVAILTEDPSNAKGHQVLGAADYHLVWMGFSSDPERMKDEALREITSAISRDDSDEYSHWIHGNVLGMLFGRYDEAVSAYEQALELNPNFSLAYGSLGTVLSLAGRSEESISNIETCIRLNPRDPSVFFRYSALALAHFGAGDLNKAKEWAQRTLSRRENWWLAHAILAAAQAYLGDMDEARRTLRRLFALLSIDNMDQLPVPPMEPTLHAKLIEGLKKAAVA